MNVELLQNIINELVVVSPKLAKKMNQLLVSYREATCEEKKDKYEKIIRYYLYNFFVKCLTRDSRYEIFDSGLAILEASFGIEHEAGDSWHIGYSGAVRMNINDGQVKIKNYIPRDYKKGFYLETPENMGIVDKTKEIEFYTEFSGRLEQLSDMMDQRQEAISGHYHLRSMNVSRQLAEKMISFLGLPRIDSFEELKRDTREKVKC